jgi:uncharacterized protein YjiS (DUF1127 family)
MHTAHDSFRPLCLSLRFNVPIFCSAATEMFRRVRQKTGQTMTHFAQSVAGVTHVSGIAAFFRSLRETMADKTRRDQAYRRTLAELGGMTDKDLADIGITRYMIRDIAIEAANRA